MANFPSPGVDRLQASAQQRHRLEGTLYPNRTLLFLTRRSSDSLSAPSLVRRSSVSPSVQKQSAPNRKRASAVALHELVAVEGDSRELSIWEPQPNVRNQCILNGSVTKIASVVRGQECDPWALFRRLPSGVMTAATGQTGLYNILLITA
jgi:hypothetical protein